jgi:hypothetical protein
MERLAPASAAPVVQLRVASRKLREVLGVLEELPEGAQEQVADLIRALRDSLRWGMVLNPVTNFLSHFHAPPLPYHLVVDCQMHVVCVAHMWLTNFSRRVLHTCQTGRCTLRLASQPASLNRHIYRM